MRKRETTPESLQIVVDVVVSQLRHYTPEPHVSAVHVDRLYEACGRDVEILGELVSAYAQSPAGRANSYDLAPLITDPSIFKPLVFQAREAVRRRKEAASERMKFQKIQQTIEDTKHNVTLQARAHVSEAGFDPDSLDSIKAFLVHHVGFTIEISPTDGVLIQPAGPAPDRSSCFWCRVGPHLYLYARENQSEIFKCRCQPTLIFGSREEFLAHIAELEARG